MNVRRGDFVIKPKWLVPGVTSETNWANTNSFRATEKVWIFMSFSNLIKCMAQIAAFLESPPSAPNLHADFFFPPSQLEEMGGREWVGLGDGMEYNAESRQPTAEDHANQPKTKTSSRCMCNEFETSPFYLQRCMKDVCICCPSKTVTSVSEFFTHWVT